MQPLNFSDNQDDEEETLSFLPHDPPIQITVTTSTERQYKNKGGKDDRKRRRKEHPPGKRIKHRAFCLPWMVESILFMMIIACVVLVKALYRARIYHTRDNNGKLIEEWKDLKTSDIKHWCLDSNVTECKCANPLTPVPRYGHDTWTFAYHQNLRQARRYEKKRRFRELDVVFLGDSILEGFKGTKFGRKAPHKKENVPVFESLFDVSKGAEYDGMVLAIAGDKSPNLLWRIENGEFPEQLEPKIFWLLIGTNDFLKDDLDYCSEEVVLMGIKRVVGEIQMQRPEATIVINGLLPRATRSSKGLVYDSDGKTSIMDAIDNVNEELKSFCEPHDNLYYFDAKALFVIEEEFENLEHKQKIIPHELMGDFLHPTALGYHNWGVAIVKEIRKILDGHLVDS